MAVVKYATLSNGQTKTTVSTGQPVVGTQAEVAAIVGINKSTVSDAKTLSAYGTPEEIEAVRNGQELITPVARKVRARRDAANDAAAATRKANWKDTPGCRADVPDGKTISGLVSEGLELERQGVEREDVPKKIGLTKWTYSKARDLVLLSRRDDLNAKDVAIVERALQEVDETRRVQVPWQQVRPIVERVWGKSGNRHTSDKRRSRQFDNAISFVANACDSAVDIQIPHITEARADSAVKRLTEAQDALQQLKKRIRKGGTE